MANRNKYRKLNNKSGETLVEVLVAMLIVMLASSLVALCIAQSVRTNKAAEAKDAEYKQYQKELADAGPAAVLGDGTVTFTAKSGTTGTETVSVQFFGTNKSFRFEKKN